MMYELSQGNLKLKKSNSWILIMLVLFTNLNAYAFTGTNFNKAVSYFGKAGISEINASLFLRLIAVTMLIVFPLITAIIYRILLSMFSPKLNPGLIVVWWWVLIGMIPQTILSFVAGYFNMDFNENGVLKFITAVTGVIIFGVLLGSAEVFEKNKLYYPIGVILILNMLIVAF